MRLSPCLSRPDVNRALSIDLTHTDSLCCRIASAEGAHSGTIPSLDSTTRLQALNFEGNRLSGMAPCFHAKSVPAGATGSLTVLRSSSVAAGTIPDSLVELTNLRSLKLANNRLVGNLPAAVGKLRALEVLDVYNNSMDGDVPSSIRDLLELRELYLANEHLLPLRELTTSHTRELKDPLGFVPQSILAKNGMPLGSNHPQVANTAASVCQMLASIAGRSFARSTIS